MKGTAINKKLERIVLIMIYVIYLLLAATVVWCSVKCANYVDLLDKKTNLSGAFIGGVILAAVTSLPELFTSISALFVLKSPRPELILGNILGSNIFNIAALSCIIIFTVKGFLKANIMKSHIGTVICTALLYLMLMFSTFVFNIDFHFLTVSVLSVVILLVYAFSVRKMAGDESETDEDCDSTLTVRQIVLRFLLTAVCLVAASIAVTYVTDRIQQQLPWLGATLAGAVLLGVATSLPELSSCIALAKKGNHNAALGNITGSNIFNMFIIVIADILFWSGSVYLFDRQARILLVFGFISMAALLLQILLKRSRKEHSKVWYILLSSVSVLCYILFLVLSLI